MPNHNKSTIYDVNNSLLASSLWSQKNGFPASKIESVEDMSNFIKEEFIEVLITPFLQEVAIDCIIYELN